MICTPYPILCGKIEKNEIGPGIWRVWGKENCAQGFGGEA
jgi:hypothetical protein